MRLSCIFACVLLVIAPLALAEPAQRIVSVGGSLTEIVYAVGAEDRLVAVDSTSRYPEAAQALPDVGYMRQLAAEPILALDPDLLLLIENAGPPAVIEQLRAAGLPIVSVPDAPSLAGVQDKVARVARALELPKKGDAMIAELEAPQKTIQARLADMPAKDERPRVLFLLSIGDSTPLAAGRDTAAAGVIELAGGRNALRGFSGYKPLSPEAAVNVQPDVILVTEDTLELLGGREALLTRPELAASPAAKNDRLIAMDALLLLGFGPRTPGAVTSLTKALYPDRVLEP